MRKCIAESSNNWVGDAWHQRFDLVLSSINTVDVEWHHFFIFFLKPDGLNETESCKVNLSTTCFSYSCLYINSTQFTFGLQTNASASSKISDC